MPSWDMVRSVLALHQYGTFDSAAHSLGVDHSTLRRRIQQLEQELDRTIFQRHDGKYVLASGMEPLLDAALGMDASFRLFTHHAAEVGGGRIRMSMLDIFATWLAPALGAFKRQHPGITLDLTTEHHFVDLEREHVDVAIRMARPTRGDSRIRRIGRVAFATYASPDYLDRFDRGLTDGEHALLALSVHFVHGDHDFLVGETRWMLDNLPPGRVAAHTDSYRTLQHFCEQGMGLALLPRFLADRSPGLVRLPHVVTGDLVDLWLLVHRDMADVPHIRMLLDFVDRAFQAHQDALHPSD